jgi:hypothetical protein
MRDRGGDSVISLGGRLVISLRDQAPKKGCREYPLNLRTRCKMKASCLPGMERSSILAHRGLFLNELDKNSSEAIKRALGEGFGVETDLRDHDGRVVISHDPPRASPSPLSFEWLLDEIIASSANGRIGLNIKSDGLSGLIESRIKSKPIHADRFFVFDMSAPDSIPYLKSSIPVYSRISEHEHTPLFHDKVEGIWVDNFDGSFLQVERAKSIVEQGIRAAIVSPELHCRDHTKLWDSINYTGLYLSPLFELCTDYPVEAANRFCKH